MALTNSERQRRFREKRNALAELAHDGGLEQTRHRLLHMAQGLPVGLVMLRSMRITDETDGLIVATMLALFHGPRRRWPEEVEAEFQRKKGAECISDAA